MVSVDHLRSYRLRQNSMGVSRFLYFIVRVCFIVCLRSLSALTLALPKTASGQVELENRDALILASIGND